MILYDFTELLTFLSIKFESYSKRIIFRRIFNRIRIFPPVIVVHQFILPGNTLSLLAFIELKNHVLCKKFNLNKIQNLTPDLHQKALQFTRTFFEHRLSFFSQSQPNFLTWILQNSWFFTHRPPTHINPAELEHAVNVSFPLFSNMWSIISISWVLPSNSFRWGFLHFPSRESSHYLQLQHFSE